jgi:putative transposase
MIIIVDCLSNKTYNLCVPRIARVVIPNLPHHITQRGNRRLPTFFGDQDYKRYLQIMAELCAKYGVEIWAYCLMPNHVHLVAVPDTKESLAAAIGEAHRRYTRLINKREEWRGFLWQGRFASFPMDEAHLYLATRYVELNPVRAGLVQQPWQYRWSSAAAHIAGRDDILVRVAPLLKIFGDWEKYLKLGIDEEDSEKIKHHIRSGVPLGNDAFISNLEEKFGLDFRPQKRGPKGSLEKSKTSLE